MVNMQGPMYIHTHTYVHAAITAKGKSKLYFCGCVMHTAAPSTSVSQRAHETG
jgi:hypothetical protein